MCVWDESMVLCPRVLKRVDSVCGVCVGVDILVYRLWELREKTIVCFSTVFSLLSVCKTINHILGLQIAVDGTTCQTILRILYMPWCDCSTSQGASSLLVLW